MSEIPKTVEDVLNATEGYSFTADQMASVQALLDRIADMERRENGWKWFCRTFSQTTKTDEQIEEFLKSAIKRADAPKEETDDDR